MATSFLRFLVLFSSSILSDFMVKLNFPEFEYKWKRENDKLFIFDVIRKKYVMLTPEEWVRQHVVNYLINSLKYPKSLFKVEGGLRYNQLQKRSDITIFDRSGAAWMIIECKSPELKLNQQVLEQVSVYNSTMNAKYIAITNGLSHYCFEIKREEQLTTLLPDFPAF
ncbi:MAG: type I restriction enzyme HsdR N-terminal domain-containing protein [Flammeovirgaceae bacterium]|nr:type I restriction enzyme HsdR N-terminal domain-containing protein [Flammeovirgaceae bacterium]